MDDNGTSPGALRRVIGGLIGLTGTTIIAAMVLYFALNRDALFDVAIMIFAVFGITVAASLVAFGVFLAAASPRIRRVGCVATVIFAVPMFLLFIFLVVSLFQTAKAPI